MINMTYPVDVKERVTIARIWNDANVEELWRLWTTKTGIESWWGPEGAAVKVQKLDLHPEGELVYTTIALAERQVSPMKEQRMPFITEGRIYYTEVDPPHRLEYVQLIDFVPEIKPYSVATTIDLNPYMDGVRLVVGFDAMHDPVWTQRTALGWECQLLKLAKVLGTGAAVTEGSSRTS
jgi:uncharacterized protein YndB with AHSA1/START domain